MVLTIQTNGNTDIVDITDDVASLVAKGKVKDGIAALFVKGSTASLTTIEADGNLYEDFRAVLEKIAPMDADWQHHKTWGMTMEVRTYVQQLSDHQSAYPLFIVS